MLKDEKSHIRIHSALIILNYVLVVTWTTISPPEIPASNRSTWAANPDITF
ncbi:uncharacterized protein BT62DRAFT_925699, partial [Guyanagaster necrorhizus]